MKIKKYITVLFGTMLAGFAIGVFYTPNKIVSGGVSGIATILFYIATTALAVTIALLVAYMINPGIGLDMDSIQKSEVTSTNTETKLTDTLLNIIPKIP